jgi:Na+-transporting NADH:ubiquinone oxidoreductase subunit NqrC
MNHPKIRKEYNYLMNETKKKYELNYDRAVQDLYDIRDKALEAGSFNAAISAQNSLLKVGGLVVDRKEVMFGKIDQMSREEVEKRLAQLMGNVALTDGSGEADQRSSQEDEAISLERLEIEDQLTVDQKLEENSTVD